MDTLAKSATVGWDRLAVAAALVLQTPSTFRCKRTVNRKYQGESHTDFDLAVSLPCWRTGQYAFAPQPTGKSEMVSDPSSAATGRCATVGHLLTRKAGDAQRGPTCHAAYTPPQDRTRSASHRLMPRVREARAEMPGPLFLFRPQVALIPVDHPLLADRRPAAASGHGSRISRRPPG